MEPRKLSLRREQSTSLPVEYVLSVEELFKEAFPAQLKDKKLFIEGRIFSDEVLLSVGFKPEESGLRQVNFEASMDHVRTDLMKKLGLCADALVAVAEQYFAAGGELELPRQWKSFPFENESVWIQFSGRNTELEAEADRLLGIDGAKSLYIEAEDLDETEEEPLH